MPGTSYACTWGPKTYWIHGPENEYLLEESAKNRFFYEFDALSWLWIRGASGFAVDVGAHVGLHSVFFSDEMQLPTIAIEPNPRAIPYLRKNTQDRNVEVHECAVHNEWANAGMLDIVQNNMGMARAYEGGSIPCRRLDEIIDGREVGLIKIDVEGEEVSALQSARLTILRCGPTIMAEVNTNAALDAYRAFLEPLGYGDPIHFGGKNGMVPNYLWESPNG